MLRTVGNLLQAHIRDTDYLGRLGGDEFAILLPRSNKRNGVRRAEELDRKLNNAYAAWGEQQIPINASCGVHMYAAKAELHELLQAADAAMYKDQTGTAREVQSSSPLSPSLVRGISEFFRLRRLHQASGRNSGGASPRRLEPSAYRRRL